MSDEWSEEFKAGVNFFLGQIEAVANGNPSKIIPDRYIIDIEEEEEGET